MSPKTAFGPARSLASKLAIVLLAFSVSACAGGALSPGLVARMDSPGASLDRAEALNLINQYRASRGVAPLRSDPGLNSKAQALAGQYATTGNLPPVPGQSIVQMRGSAGYANFAETFSGWRGSADDARAIADPAADIAGIAVAYAPNSAYGVHWILLLGQAPTPEPDFVAQ